jgi:hypothetical protein
VLQELLEQQEHKDHRALQDLLDHKALQELLERKELKVK